MPPLTRTHIALIGATVLAVTASLVAYGVHATVLVLTLIVVGTALTSAATVAVTLSGVWAFNRLAPNRGR